MNIVDWAKDLLFYGKAFARHFVRSAPWVTLMCALLWAVLISLPQASELVLSQATLPQAQEAVCSFWVRLIMLTVASLVLAWSIWGSARLLIMTEWDGRPGCQRGSFDAAVQAYQDRPETLDRAQLADLLGALYVPRQLGLSVFVTLQWAAGRSISEEGYGTPLALVILWLVVLSLALMRLSGIKGTDLRAWWIGLLVVAVGVAVWEGLSDWEWIRDRVASDDWRSQQGRAVLILGGFAAGAGALLLGLTRWIVGSRSSVARQGLATLATLLVVVLAFLFAYLSAAAPPGKAGPGRELYGAFFLLQSLAALIYWTGVMGRRRLVQILDRRCSPDSPWRRLLSWTHDRPTLVLLGVVAALSAALMAVATAAPLQMGGHLGALGIVLLFLAFLILAVSMAQAFIGRTSWRNALPGSLIGVALLVMLFLADTRPQAPPARPGPAAALAEARPADRTSVLQSSQDVFALAAHGGGIRAALYTASFAAWLDHYTSYQFSDRLLAGSGASGGSVGLAVWSAARSAGCNVADDKKIKGQEGDIPRCVQAVNGILAHDHLSPLIATGLFRDYFRFWANPERGNTLQASILAAAHKLDGKVLAGVGQRLESPALAAGHALMLNTAQVGSAKPLSLTTREGMLPRAAERGGGVSSFVESLPGSSFSLLTAAMHSARFPLISPKGRVDLDHPFVVVDGGYFDNSGVSVLRQHLLALQSETKTRPAGRLILINLDNEPIAADEPLGSTEARDSADEVLATVLAARGAHGAAAWHQLCHEFAQAHLFSARPGAPVATGCRLPAETDLSGRQPLWKQQLVIRRPALGWYLSPRSARRVTEDAKAKAWFIAERLGYTSSPDVGPTPSIQRLK